jgi:hypothetical protein
MLEVKVLDGNFPKDLEIKQVVSQTYLYISPSSYHPQRAANFYIGGFLTYHNHFLVSALRGLARLGRLFLWRPSREGEGWRNKQAKPDTVGASVSPFPPPLCIRCTFTQCQQMAHANAFSQRIVQSEDR